MSLGEFLTASSSYGLGRGLVNVDYGTISQPHLVTTVRVVDAAA